MTCPMCRVHFDKLFVPVIDYELQAAIKAEMGEQFEERKAELEKEGNWNLKRLLRFAFGNTHEELKKENAQAARSDPSKQNIHRWAMFVAFNDNKDETARYIKSVTYHLHPTFRPNKIKVSEAPFLLSRLGWGYFPVEFDVEFHEWTKLGTVKMEHMLSFDNKGHT